MSSARFSNSAPSESQAAILRLCTVEDADPVPHSIPCSYRAAPPVQTIFFGEFQGYEAKELSLPSLLF